MSSTLQRLVSSTTLLLAALLAACGGGAPDAEPTVRTRAAAPGAVPLPWGIDQPAPLSAQATEPADPGARTRRGRYLSPVQATQMKEALGVMVIAVDVESGPDALAAIDLAKELAWGYQAAHQLPADVPVLVSSSNLRLAAAAVHQLEASGYSRVFLVTR